MILLTVGMLSIPEWWSIPCMIVGTLLMVVFYRHQKRERYPVLNVEVFSSRMYTRSVVAAFLNYASSYAVSFFAVLYLQDVNGWSPSKAGMLLLIQPVIQAVFTPLTGRLSDRIAGRILPTAGMVLLCIGLAVILIFPTEVSMLMIVVALILLGMGYAMFSAPNTNAVMSSVSAKLYSEAAATLSMMRQTGMLLSMGIASACIALTLGNSAHISDNVPAFMDAMRAAILIFAGLSIVGTLLSWFRGNSEEIIDA
jgi:MFS family permease